MDYMTTPVFVISLVLWPSLCNGFFTGMGAWWRMR